MTKGGVRPGAGRPRKAEKFAGAVAAAEERIADGLPGLVDKLFELAEGVEVEKADRRGDRKVYSEPPCFKALEYLLNRIMGRPTERHEHTGEDGGPIPLSVQFGAALAKVYGRPDDGPEPGAA